MKSNRALCRCQRGHTLLSLAMVEVKIKPRGRITATRPSPKRDERDKKLMRVSKFPSTTSSSSLVDIVCRFDRQVRRNLISLHVAQSQSSQISNPPVQHPDSKSPVLIPHRPIHPPPFLPQIPCNKRAFSPSNDFSPPSKPKRITQAERLGREQEFSSVYGPYIPQQLCRLDRRFPASWRCLW